MGDKWSTMIAPSQAKQFVGTFSNQGSGVDAFSLNCVTMEPKRQLRIPVIGITQEVNLLTYAPEKVYREHMI